MSGKSKSHSGTKELLRLLNSLGASLNTTLDLAEIQKQILDAVISIDNIDAVCVYVYNDNIDDIALENSSGFSAAELKSIRQSLFSNEIFDQLKSGKSLYSEFPPVRKFPAMAVIPFVYLGVTLGAIILGSKEKNAFDEEIRLACETIAARASGIIRRTRNEDSLKTINHELGTVNSRLQVSEERYRAIVEDQMEKFVNKFDRFTKQ